MNDSIYDTNRPVKSFTSWRVAEWLGCGVAGWLSV